MKNRLKHNLFAWALYTVGTYIALLPLGLWVTGVPIAVATGFLFGMLNTIIHLLRKINKKLKVKL